VSQSFVLASAESNAPSPASDCLAHRFGNAADGPERVRCYGSGLTDAEWQVVRPLLPVPAWLQEVFHVRRGRRAGRVTASLVQAGRSWDARISACYCSASTTGTTSASFNTTP
jgi:hypothetical protein